MAAYVVASLRLWESAVAYAAVRRPVLSQTRAAAQIPFDLLSAPHVGTHAAVGAMKTTRHVSYRARAGRASYDVATQTPRHSALVVALHQSHRQIDLDRGTTRAQAHAVVPLECSPDVMAA